MSAPGFFGGSKDWKRRPGCADCAHREAEEDSRAPAALLGGHVGGACRGHSGADARDGDEQNAKSECNRCGQSVAGLVSQR